MECGVAGKKLYLASVKPFGFAAKKSHFVPVDCQLLNQLVRFLCGGSKCGILLRGSGQTISQSTGTPEAVRPKILEEVPEAQLDCERARLRFSLAPGELSRTRGHPINRSNCAAPAPHSAPEASRDCGCTLLCPARTRTQESRAGSSGSKTRSDLSHSSLCPSKPRT